MKKIGKIAFSEVTEMSGNKITRMSAFQSGLINRNSRRGEFPQNYIFPTLFFVSFLHIALTLKLKSKIVIISKMSSLQDEQISNPKNIKIFLEGQTTCRHYRMTPLYPLWEDLD